MLKFYWNGIKDGGGKLQTCSYYTGSYINLPAGTIAIYKKGYDSFSKGIQEAFIVENDSDIQSDYFVTDTIRVRPEHPLYESVKAALQARDAHLASVAARRNARHASEVAS